MTKKAAIIVTASVVALSLIVVIINQGGIISTLKQTILSKDKALAVANQKLVEQVAYTDELNDQLQVYKDSVNLLQLENQQLRSKVESLKGTITRLNLIIQKHDDKVGKLTAEINRLREAGRTNSSKMAELEHQRDDLLKQMENIDHQRITLMEEKKQREEEQRKNSVKIEVLQSNVTNEMDKVDPAPVVLDPPAINQSPTETSITGAGPNVSDEMQAAIVSRQAERLANIMSKTKVNFSTVSLRNREGGNELKKIKKKDNDWRYTFIDFDLENIDREAIIDETFVLQVFDLDNNAVVPFNEKNMAFPNSEMGAIGYKFKYDGKPVSVRYINTQAKEGSNYEIRLVYINKKGLTFPLASGTKRIVVEGKVTVD